jgi:probable O-glycosylation ligase (exosortase A-associated)
VKQMIFMIGCTLLGTVGVLVDPFYGVFVYYLFAVLRPQFMWYWVEIGWWKLGDFNWSAYVAVPTIIAAVIGYRGSAADRASEQGFDPRLGPDARPRGRTWAHYSMFAFAAWILITCLTARHFDVAWDCTKEYLKIFAMYGVAMLLVRSVKQVVALFVMVAVAIAYIAYEVNFKYFFEHHRLDIFHSGYCGLDNNGAALMLAMGVPLCWFAYEGWHGWLGPRYSYLRPLRYGFICVIPAIIHAVLMTYSRGAMLSLIVMVPLLWWRSRQKYRLSVAILAFILLALPVLAGPEIRARFLSIQDNETDDSANSRRASWAAGWEIAKDNPLLGVGVRNANQFSYEYGADMKGRTIHSQYFQILADNGFPGLALYLLVLAGAWVSLRRCRRFAESGPPGNRPVGALASGIECSLFLFMFGSAFLSLEVFELPYLLLLMAAQLAVVSGAWQVRPEQTAPLAVPPYPDDQETAGSDGAPT